MAALTEGVPRNINSLCFAALLFAGRRGRVVARNSAPVTQFELKAGADIYALLAKAPQFLRARDPELDKVTLKEAVKTGEEIPSEIAVVQLEGKRFLRIR
jgi:hypothetical protein